jgi:hypothetical protein
MVKATMEGLKRLKSARDVAKRRGISVKELFMIEQEKQEKQEAQEEKKQEEKKEEEKKQEDKAESAE